MVPIESNRVGPRVSADVRGDVRLWLRLEGLLVFVAAIVVYDRQGFSWWLFALLFLAPDLSFLAYLMGPRVGARVYNLLHTYASALACLLSGFLLSQPLLLAVGLAWCAHIGFDRTLGYGLKFPEGFHSTHLGRIGRQSRYVSAPERE